MSRVLRIQEDAEAIALAYGPNVSEGIRTMERLLARRKEAVDYGMIRAIIREELDTLRGY
ncbi:MAG: hypothetical protein GKC04_08435 [Methanomicrobiales archaeon]|nr:hypothetical protein [Methanomicrobiales archaeon]